MTLVQAATPLSERPDILRPRAVPGPRSAQLLDRQVRRESNARTYPRRLPIAMANARGPYVEDLDGNVYVDFLMGAGVLPLGYGHPELTAAIVEQADKLTHGLDFPTPAKDAFTEAQLSMLPAAMRDRMKIHFCGPTGANTVDAAIKLAKTATGRSEVVSFRGGFHGTTHLSMSLTGLVEMREPVPNTMPGVHFAPYSYCTRCPLGLQRGTCETNCATWLETGLTDANGGMLPPAAIVIELVQGEGGVIPADPDFARRVAAIAKRTGALLVVDEVQTGGGRTGTWFAFEQYGIEPDIICVSKALSGAGLPMGVILYREELDVWRPGAHTGTFRGNQLGFAAGLAMIEVFRRERVLDNVLARGAQLRRLLRPLVGLPHVREVRGLGLMWGVELQDPITSAPSGQLARAAQSEALAHGLILEVGGRDDCVLRMLPPLNIESDLIAAASQVIVTIVQSLEIGEAAPVEVAS